MIERWHGTIGGYNNHRCRCDACRAANAEYMRAAREANKGLPIPAQAHGTDTGYCYYGCRCIECLEAHRAVARRQMKRTRARRRAEASR